MAAKTSEKEGKKRKRQSDETQSPSKKIALDSNAQLSGDFKVSFAQDGLRPALVSTQGLKVPDVPFKAYSRARLAKHADREVDPNTHDLLLHSSSHPQLDYNAAPDALEHNISHYVAIIDPTTKQLQITPVHRLNLRSTVRAEEQEMAERKTMMEQREALGREFGTKKARKVIASRTENAITADTKGKGKATDVQSAILEAVGETTSGVAKRSAKEEADLIFASKPIPKPNLEAESVEEVYTFDTLIPPNHARHVQIKDWQEKLRADEGIPFRYDFPRLWMERHKDADDVLRLKALSYLTLLLEFHGVLSKGGRGGKKVPKKEVLSKRLEAWPAPLVDAVRRRFTDDSGSDLGKWHQDNLYTHICALALYLDGWVSETTALKDDLRLETKQLGQYFSELGCKVAAPTASEQSTRKLTKAKAAVTRIARLKLPLEFPKPRKGKRQA